MTANQIQLPGIITGEPIECDASELTATLERIRAAGFHVLQMHVITKPRQGYRLTVTRCACDICRELSQPSDEIESALRPDALTHLFL